MLLTNWDIGPVAVRGHLPAENNYTVIIDYGVRGYDITQITRATTGMNKRSVEKFVK